MSDVIHHLTATAKNTLYKLLSVFI